MMDSEEEVMMFLKTEDENDDESDDESKENEQPNMGLMCRFPFSGTVITEAEEEKKEMKRKWARRKKDNKRRKEIRLSN